MKNYSTKLLAVLLAVILAVSACTALGVSAEETDVVEEAAQAVAEQEEVENPVPAVTGEAPTQAPDDQAENTEAVNVGAVKNVVKESFESDSITLSWDAVDGADGYYIYLCNADESTEFVKIGETDTNTYTATGLQHTTQYHFRVSAFVNKDGEIYEGAQTTKKTATQPGPLTGLTKWRSSSVLQIDWDSNPKATGYRIYRTSKESDNKEVLYKTIYGCKNTSFSDTAVKPGNTYTFRVKSFRELYNTSYSSDAGKEVFIAGLCGPDYSITSRCRRVNLTWKKNPYATHYEVYYSTSPDNSKFVKLFTTPRLYYNTSKLTKGKTYYFRIRPIYQKGDTLITGTSNKKSAVVTDKAYGKATGNTYIEISISQQHMWYYKNGTQIVSTDVVTGNAGTNDTPKGYFTIYSKARNTTLRGTGYSSFVNYWMAFRGGYGIHDSSWRSSYGNPIYQGNGSHGCVNTPKAQVKKIYENASCGTPVIIY